MVNGEEQTEAKFKDKQWKEGIGGKILDFKTTKSWDYVKMDPTNAYPGKELKHWVRYIILDKENNFAIVLDKVNCDLKAGIEVRFQPGVDFNLTNQQVLLTSQKSSLEMIPFGNTPLVIKTGRLPKVSLRSSETAEWHNYFAVTTVANKEENTIGSVFIPVNQEKNSVEFVEADQKQLIKLQTNGKLINYTISGDGIKRSSK
jgi:hypothetical protein